MTKWELLNQEYLELLKKHNLTELETKKTFKERYDLIQKMALTDDPQLKHNADVWQKMVDDYAFDRLDLSPLERVEHITATLSNYPALYGHAKIIKKVVQEYGYSLDQEVYFNIFPTNDFNAAVYPSEHGSLILLNTGVIKLVHNIIYHCFYKLSNQYLFASNKEELDKKITGHIIAMIVNYLCRFEHRSIFLNKFELDKETMDSAFLLIGGVKNFIVSHEISHVILGHDSKSQLRSLPRQSNQHISVYNHSHQLEYEADNLAQKLLIFHDQHDHLFPSIGGGLSFFLIHMMVLNVHSKLSYRPELYLSSSKSHPPAIERIRKIDQLTQQYDFRPLADGLANCTLLQRQLIKIEKSEIFFDDSDTLKVVLNTI